MDPNTRWQYCDVTQCPAAVTQPAAIEYAVSLRSNEVEDRGEGCPLGDATLTSKSIDTTDIQLMCSATATDLDLVTDYQFFEGSRPLGKLTKNVYIIKAGKLGNGDYTCSYYHGSLSESHTSYAISFPNKPLTPTLSYKLKLESNEVELNCEKGQDEQTRNTEYLFRKGDKFLDRSLENTMSLERPEEGVFTCFVFNGIAASNPSNPVDIGSTYPFKK